MAERQARTVIALGLAQVVAWASSYYLPAIIAAPVAADTGVPTTVVYAAVSLALLISAALGPAAGTMIDRHGGRPVLAVSSLLFAAGLGLLALAHGAVLLLAAWAILGVAMGCGLYEAAFAALVRIHGAGARPAITGITLIAGFASTVGWPLSGWLESEVGWRGTCLAWAGLHLAVGLPLNLALPGGRHRPDAAATADDPATQPAGALPLALLALVFAIGWFVSTAMATHLPRLLVAGGASLAVAVGCGALIGPAQVAARLLEFGLLRRVHPLWSARAATLAHPLGAGLFLALGAPAAAAFTLLHGAGNGILTIAKGTLPLAMFGPQGYGRQQGLLTIPARIAQAAAPLLSGLAIDAWGAGALWLSAGLGLVACAALLALRARR